MYYQIVKKPRLIGAGCGTWLLDVKRWYGTFVEQKQLQAASHKQIQKKPKRWTMSI